MGRQRTMNIRKPIMVYVEIEKAYKINEICSAKGWTFTDFGNHCFDLGLREFAMLTQGPYQRESSTHPHDDTIAPIRLTDPDENIEMLVDREAVKKAAAETEEVAVTPTKSAILDILNIAAGNKDTDPDK